MACLLRVTPVLTSFYSLQNGSNEPDDRTWPSHRNGLENGGPGVNRRTDWNYSGKGRRFDHRKNDPEFRRGRYQQQYPPPPPPPVNGTPVQARNGDKKDHSSNHHSPADTSENGHQHSDEVKLEPSADNSKENRADASAQRSRHKRTRAEDSDSGDEPRRQVDDVTPRMKRRQPQVAAAYRYINPSQSNLDAR